MTLKEINDRICGPEYDFLRRTDSIENLVLLAISGSHAYGTNVETSDVDLRGVALNSAREIFLGEDFEHVVNTDTDTTIYSFNKMLALLTANNPNTLEILGCKPEHYLVKTQVGQDLIDNRKLFLSRNCIRTFGDYATKQLRRLENKSVRTSEQDTRENHILKTIKNVEYEYKRKYFTYDEDAIKLYVDDSDREGFIKEIFMDLHLEHYPLRDWTNMWNDMKCIVSGYEKFGKRNTQALTHDKLGKHMEHLMRLFITCIDILEKEDIITYREKEHDLLMDIRLGKYLHKDGMPRPEFYELLNDYENRLDYAKNNTSLQDSPNYKEIREFKVDVNSRVARGKL